VQPCGYTDFIIFIIWSLVIFIPGWASAMCIMACFFTSPSPIGEMSVQPQSHDIILAMVEYCMRRSNKRFARLFRGPPNV